MVSSTGGQLAAPGDTTDLSTAVPDEQSVEINHSRAEDELPRSGLVQ